MLFTGHVWKAKWKGSLVAIKLFKQYPKQGTNQRASSSSAAAVAKFAMFEREISVLSRARHHNITHYIGAMVTTDMYTGCPVPSIIMELIDGGTLRALLFQLKSALPEVASVHQYQQWQEHVGISWPIDISMQLSEGIAYLHSLSIIHRDLKPSNVLCSNKGAAAKISDFGLAKLTTDAHDRQFFGTKLYAAPEALANRDVGTGVDIYALGLITVELFAGHDRWLDLHGAGSQVPSKPKLPAGMPPKLQSLLQRCLDDSPALRPSATEVQRVLEQVRLETEPANVAEPVATPTEESSGCSSASNFQPSGNMSQTRQAVATVFQQRSQVRVARAIDLSTQLGKRMAQMRKTLQEGKQRAEDSSEAEVEDAGEEKAEEKKEEEEEEEEEAKVVEGDGENGLLRPSRGDGAGAKANIEKAAEARGLGDDGETGAEGNSGKGDSSG